MARVPCPAPPTHTHTYTPRRCGRSCFVAPNPLDDPATRYHTLPSATTRCHQLPHAAISYHTLPSATTPDAPPGRSRSTPRGSGPACESVTPDACRHVDMSTPQHVSVNDTGRPTISDHLIPSSYASGKLTGIPTTVPHSPFLWTSPKHLCARLSTSRCDRTTKTCSAVFNLSNQALDQLNAHPSISAMDEYQVCERD